MKKTIALAALLAATAFTPAFAQNVEIDTSVAAAPRAVDLPPSAPMQFAQNEQRRERGQRRQNGGQEPGGGENAGRVYQPADQQRAAMRAERVERREQGGGWQQRQQMQAPTAPAAPVVQVQPPVQTQRQWNRNADGTGMGGRNRDGGNAQQRLAQPAVPSVASEQRVQRNDADRDGNRFGRRDGRMNDRVDAGRRDTWRNNVQRNDGVRGDNARNDTQVQRRWDNQGQNWQNRNRQSWNNQNWNGQNWNRSWRNDRQYDWQRYRYSNRNLFSSQRYYAPYGWNYGYRRFSVGFSLSSILFDQQYWIDDPYSYRLPPAYGPYRWVRYYDDVMLVDLRSGQVIDVIHDFFY